MVEDVLVNVDIEKRVLGCVFKDPALLLEEDLDEWCFSHQEYKLLYLAMKAVSKNKEDVDLVHVEQRLRDSHKLDNGGVNLMTLFDVHGCMPTSAGGKSYIQILKKLAMKRILRDFAKETIVKLQTEDVELEKLASSLQDNINWLLCANDNNQDVIDIAATMKEAVASLKERAAKHETGLPTGFVDYDKVVGGLFKGDLNILAARPGMGKTALAMNIARNVVYKQNKSILFVSLEMGREELRERLIASMAGVDASKLRILTGITKEEWDRIDAVASIAKRNFNVMSDSGCTPNEVKHKAKQIQATRGLDLIIVDYLQLMNADYAKPGDRLAAITEISRALKTMAQELQVPVIALSQLNRGVEARQDKRPMLSDLRESGSIEQDADLVMFLYRDSYYDPDTGDDCTELNIAKNRHGARPKIELLFREKNTEFVSVYRGGSNNARLVRDYIQ